ncbi:MAG: hypothetical protein CSA65_00490 [Proteobacteria bacterium]|nr:MAG: hypothetical protein CSB49_00050 [Pseudomonadota bacterium]PIE19954.1 MAG: hypothetical protein CSA65_00490 [Pseudomonadota bacterium]
MSRAYRIAVSESLRRHVWVGDGVETTLELLSVLPQDRMATLLAAELSKLGVEREGDTCRRVDDEGVTIEVELLEGTVTVSLSAEAELELERETVAASYTQEGLKEAANERREQLQRRLEAAADAKEEALRLAVSEKLERKLRDVQAELDGAVNRATAAALKEKAAQLGEIEEISEDVESGELTIRVRL